MKRALGAAAAVLTTLRAAPTLAAEGPGDTISLPCRPTIACTADLVRPGAFEVEAGYLHRSLAAGLQLSFPVLFKLTITDWAQLQVGSNGYTENRGASPSRFFDNVTFGAKLHLLDQGSYVPSVSVSFAVAVPTFAETGYERSYDVLMTSYLTKDIGRLHADLNVGLNRFAVGDDPVSQEWLALALSTPLPPPFGVMVESYYFTRADPAASRDGGVLFALSHTPAPWLVFDFGGDVGLVPGARTFSVFVGVTMVPFLLWRS